MMVLGMGTLALSGTARGDDSALFGVGGVLKPMHGHPSVRMVSEEVHIKLPQDEVEASFTFHNDGQPVTVLIGFPEQGKGKNYTQFTHFRSSVDGKPIKVMRFVQEKPSDEENDDYYKYWWIKRVHFDRGQTRVILNRYEGGAYVTDYGVAGFNYILRTGASWKGPIGRARIVCDLRGLHNNAPMAFQPAGYRRIGDTVVWDLHNFKPKQDIHIEWTDGFLDIQVNGDPVVKKEKDEGDADMPIWTELEVPIPFKQGNDVWLSVRTAADWLDAELTVVKPGRTLRLTHGSRWAEVTVGSPWLRTARGRLAMPHKAYRKERKTIVALRSLVTALGGKATFNKRGRLIVHL
jgi:hypothetical protein